MIYHTIKKYFSPSQTAVFNPFHFNLIKFVHSTQFSKSSLCHFGNSHLIYLRDFVAKFSLINDINPNPLHKLCLFPSFYLLPFFSPLSLSSFLFNLCFFIFLVFLSLFLHISFFQYFHCCSLSIL